MTNNQELVIFRDFLNEKIAAAATMTPEEALEEFWILNETAAEREETCAAIRESLEEIRSGSKGRPVEEYLAEVRARYGFER